MVEETETKVVPIVYSVKDLIECKGWGHFWDKFEDLWNAKSGIGESVEGEMVDCGIREKTPEVTLNITVVIKR